MADIKYRARSLRQRGNKDTWELSLTHKDPLTGEEIRDYFTIQAKSRKQAERKRDQLILALERKGGAIKTNITLREFMERFVDYKEQSGTIEASTVRDYRLQSRVISRYMGDEPLALLSIPTINNWMAQMTRDGYAPKSVAKPFRLLKQALNIYADVDPDAKKAAVSKVEDCFDVGMDTMFGDAFAAEPAPAAPGITFTVEQLEAMLAQARRREAGAA